MLGLVAAAITLLLEEAEFPRLAASPVPVGEELVRYLDQHRRTQHRRRMKAHTARLDAFGAGSSVG